ncbi:MAG: DUF1499 domain-containing protein [Acidobacteriota bacterium]
MSRPRSVRRLRILALTIVLAVAVSILAARLYLGRAAEDALLPGEVADFTHLDLGARSNVFLLCPKQPPLCSAAPDETSPVFPIGAARLRDRWLEMIAAEPRVRLVQLDPAHLRLVLIQRSAILNFPDIVTVMFIPIGDDRSTIAVLSRSRYGHSDFGVNAARVRHWLEMLEASTGTIEGASPSAPRPRNDHGRILPAKMGLPSGSSISTTQRSGSRATWRAM